MVSLVAMFSKNRIGIDKRECFLSRFFISGYDFGKKGVVLKGAKT
jgi:hypothetical protein